MKKILFLLLFIFSANLTFLYSYDLGSIIVTASSVENDFNNIKLESFSSVDVITRQQIQERTISLSELLNELPGIQVKKYGGLDEYATVSIRGSTSEQVSVLIDGIPVNNPLGGGVNISSIPMDTIEKVEVYRGSVPFSLGVQSIGGVINITTISNLKSGKEITASYGSYDYNKISLNYYSNDRISALYNINYSRAENDYKYVHDNKTHIIKSDDYIERRKNNQSDKFSLFANYNYSFNKDYTGRFSFTFQKDNKGLAGVFYNASENAKLNTTDLIFHTGLRKKNIFMFSGYIDLTLYSKFNTTKFYDPFREIGWSKKDTNDKTNQYGLSLSFETFFINNIKTSLAIFYNIVELKPEDKFDNNEFLNLKRNDIKVSFENTLLLFNERLHITPGILIERYENKRLSQMEGPFSKDVSFIKDTFISKQIGANYNVNNNLILKTSVGSYYRIPNLFELFGDKGYTVGNASLAPEKSMNIDCGIIYRNNFQRLKFISEIIYFHKNVENLIQWLSYSSQIIYPSNIGKAKLKGIESVVSLTFNDFYFKGNYAILNTENLEPAIGNLKKELPGKPKYEFMNEIGYNNSKAGIKIHLQYNWIGESYKDLGNSFKNESKEYVNIGFTYSYNNLQTNFEIKNLTDELSHDVYGFPLPGISYYGKINFKF
jgi:outer membrane cobalamin receptor